MARRTAEVTSQENGPAGDGNHQGIPSGASRFLGRLRPLLHQRSAVQSTNATVVSGAKPPPTIPAQDWSRWSAHFAGIKDFDPEKV